ncbi:indole-3-glycerol phosphate synthase TrpC [soil metagenome]
MNDFLARMETSSRTRLAAARGVAPLESVRRQAEMIATTGLPPGFLVFAEVKPISPAEGSRATSDFRDLVRAYESGGAAAISVLTEPTEFGGSMELIEEVVEAVAVPVMRKDFIVDPYQVWEARARGASGALAIARMLDTDTLEAIARAAREAGMFLLVEGFDEADLEAISAMRKSEGHVLVGVNSRDLTTLQVRPDAHEALAPLLPENCVAIAESGIRSPEQVKALASFGYHGVLVGTSLMRSDDPAAAVASLVEAGVEV